ncbi:hypothetical protein ACYFX5_00295 [Bremerella sp. T1]|uniref:hypothetical protein n=1 Tax=Bremerella sp. TYQ1 TaxID=3119568 RepID=UPI001CCC1C71|nr:hypothetical protein [Bremerella volcania]UBM36730.1 hypothetical protein LA756_02255 [Bremerella volcania]
MLKTFNHHACIALSIVLLAASFGCSNTPEDTGPSTAETFSSYVASLEGAVKTAHPQELAAASEELAESAELASKSIRSSNKEEVRQLVSEFQQFSKAAASESKKDLVQRIEKMKSLVAELDN